MELEGTLFCTAISWEMESHSEKKRKSLVWFVLTSKVKVLDIWLLFILQSEGEEKLHKGKTNVNVRAARGKDSDWYV